MSSTKELSSPQSLTVWAWSGALLTLAMSYAERGSLARASMLGLRLPLAFVISAVLLLAVLSRPNTAIWLARPLCFLTGGCFTIISLILVGWAGSLV